MLVNTNAKEFHYSKAEGEENVETVYSGTDGVRIGGLGRRLLFSLGFQSLQILFSNDITAESRVLYHRNITDRVTTIAPFLRYDEDPYLVVSSDGRLFWIRDAYTTTTRYPYSAPSAGGINYIRNSVKVITDAYNGTTEFYVSDPRDPLVQTLARAYPGLLRPLDVDARRPAAASPLSGNDFRDSGGDVLDVPHDESRGVLQQGRSVADSGDRHRRQSAADAAVLHDHAAARGGARRVHPDAAVHAGAEGQPCRVDGGAIRSRATTASSKCSSSREQKIVYGPRQIIARINQDQVISPQITLWNQQGSQVIQGTLLVIPIGEALLYVRPLYLRASGGRIPALNRVIVAYKDQIVMEPTLDAALARIFGGGGGADGPAAASRRRRIDVRWRRRRSGQQPAAAAAATRTDVALVEQRAPALRARDAGAARRQLGALRRTRSSCWARRFEEMSK